MSQSALRPGVLLSVRWGNHELAREFLAMGAPRAFTVGSDKGCDFSCGGVRALRLVEIDEQGASLRHRDGKIVPIERGAPALLALGPLTFDVQLLDAPPRVRTGAAAELTTVNLALLMMAAFGFFAVAAANSDAEGVALDDELSGPPARAVKTLINNERVRQASASAPAPKQHMEKQLTAPASARRAARQLPRSRQSEREAPSRLDLGALFKGPGAGAVFASGGLGDALTVASTGLQTANAGNGPGGLGGGRDGNGLGGMQLAAIGSLGTRGGRGPGNPFGTGLILKAGEKPEIPGFPEPMVTGCTVDGTGCLDKELIRRVIRDNIAGFRFCYESMLNRFPSLEGKVSVRFTIPPSGKVSMADAGASTANNAQLERCISERTKLLQFPSRTTGGMVVVTYPFIFRQSGK